VMPESHGGLGLDHLHLALLLDEMGGVLLPAPFLGTVLALHAVERAGSESQKKTLLPGLLGGERIAAIALCEPNASWEPDAVETRAATVDGGYELTGVKTHVSFAQAAGLVVVPARDEEGTVGLFALSLPSNGVTVEPEVCIDTTRRTSRLLLASARVPRDARLEGDGLRALSSVHQLGWVLLAAEAAGGIEATLELTRRYAVERIQFGRPIGSFQAVKHPIVDVMIGCEWVRSAALGAASAFDQDPARAPVFARMAKALASDVYDFAVKKGVQLHGGFGFTWDCDVHFHFKRSLYLRATLGDATHHRRHLGDLLLG
jgi:alkylation response protein AidB-like acyl-CoA dehydrogenase